jgi:hypothetical protein
MYLSSGKFFYLYFFRIEMEAIRSTDTSVPIYHCPGNFLANYIVSHAKEQRSSVAAVKTSDITI